MLCRTHVGAGAPEKKGVRDDESVVQANEFSTVVIEARSVTSSARAESRAAVDANS